MSKDIIKDIKTPEELFDYLSNNISFGVIDKGRIIKDSSCKEFAVACQNWHLRQVQEIIASGIGHCFDLVEVERYWFEERGYLCKSYFVEAVDNEDKSSSFYHTYIVFYDNPVWKLFEISDKSYSGIYESSNLDDLINAQAIHQLQIAKESHLPVGEYDLYVYQYQKPTINISYNNFIKNCTRMRVK